MQRCEIISLVGSVWSHFMYVTFNIGEDRGDNWFDVWDFEERNEVVVEECCFGNDELRFSYCLA